ncbi:beta-galactosidase 9 isoform X1 [Amaranthus tricolor]|uniref:beta-galactosidase 9 isoform X1 n=2 Tax=Amaranthus tricolor TaxID=29722 RepID=UPI00258D2727|nr:beta-galactosidase 9 isoform X1 [Amaranthus tricolor]
MSITLMRTPISQRWCFLFVLLSMVEFSIGKLFFHPFNVTYDHRSLIINGRRRMLISAGIHYPRATPEMWPALIAKAKEGGAEVIETYTFWNGHEPIKGEYNFEGRYDLVKFAKLVGSSGLYFFLRIGPYVCAEWNFGGFPVWLRDIPGIEFRTNNAPFKEEMQRFVTKIVKLMRDEMLFSWQGGPIIMLQIENEYGDVESSYGKKGREYVKWAANMAVRLGAGVPWVMCKQNDAPDFIINTCNGYYCDGFKPNSNKKPIFWTEDWDGWYTTWGGRLPHRPVEDLAFAVARFFQRGGSFQNYYMYFGGTNFGRTAGGPFYITSYDYDAPIDEYGLLSEPKWGHLKDLHAAIKLCEDSLVAVDSPHYVKLGPMQEAHVYHKQGNGRSSFSESGDGSRCSAFLANIDQHNVALVHFRGQTYKLPPWSVSILPDCQKVAYNTAKVGAQTSIKRLDDDTPHLSNTPVVQQLSRQEKASLVSESWMTLDEPVGLWSANNFTAQGILEHLNVTKDSSDYLWYFTRINISDEDVSFWKDNRTHPALTIDSMRDVVYIFVNGKLAGSKVGHWVRVVQPINLLEGYNDVALLSLTVGLQNYGANLEKDGGGFRGQIKLTGLKNGDMDLSKLSWTYQVGLKGEMQEIYTLDGHEKAAWVDLTTNGTKIPLSWYKTYFNAPDGLDPVALDLRSMGKGLAWVNGHHIGRYWTLLSPQDGCKQSCDYRGTYDSSKCTTNCGNPTQVRYHVPRSWLQESDNLLVVFEETGGNPFEISLTTHYAQNICAQISESHYPPLSRWLNHGSVDGQVSINDTTPEMHLHCEDGYIISVVFASYGTPIGICQKYSKGSCHAPKSSKVISRLCEGRQTCSIRVSNADLGGDPCRGVVKTLAVEAKCVSSRVAGFSSF